MRFGQNFGLRQVKPYELDSPPGILGLPCGAGYLGYVNSHLPDAAQVTPL